MTTPLIDGGKIRVMATGEKIEPGAFSDARGEKFNHDAVIVATGYKHHFPFLDAASQPADGSVLELYQHVFHPNAPGLAFLGMCGIVGAIFPVVELQARWVASCFLGDGILPDNADMTKMVKTHNKMAMMNSIKPSRVVQIKYMEVLAQELGLDDWGKRVHSLSSNQDPVVADMYGSVAADMNEERCRA